MASGLEQGARGRQSCHIEPLQVPLVCSLGLPRVCLRLQITHHTALWCVGPWPTCAGNLRAADAWCPWDLCRKNVPPYIRNLEDVERLSRGELHIPHETFAYTL